MTSRVDRLLGARLPDPPESLRRGPFRAGAFSSPLHSDRRAARVGVWLGTAFLVCFLTGLLSHLIQQPPSWFRLPASPVWGYRVTQGVHVAAGIAAVPLLLVKLWTVYPLLFEWPPASTVSRAVGRLSLLVLVGAAVMQLATGLINISQWYPFGFNFTRGHYWTGWIAIGAVAVHVGAKAPQIRRALARHRAPTADAGDRAGGRAGDGDTGLPRRAFVLATGLGVTAVTLTTVGQTLSPLSSVSLLAPRLPRSGPEDLPVNQTAAAADVERSATDPAYRLVVAGPNRLELSLADLRARPQHRQSLPIACVEGWSADATWTGVRLADLLEEAGLPAGTPLVVESLQTGGLYRTSRIDEPHARDPRTLLALQLEGRPLSLDHGFPVRLISPNRPGVMQTKWVSLVRPA
ncbi:molybdopterin-binding protein [Blastococcus sp. TF02-8]|uniref:molybdopterin-dependent oxidoreductase n=1 Tax=Blastococcus sp. TF02-8 TaxID=2250574 RepID=UPI000DEA7E17|nr:molybdopterin-dependent oxidoreductase [Blastococcus sp. TF02-8]RBY95960.1 molybdopterin-binding protein [Blastococcus sp. TF02-8]